MQAGEPEAGNKVYDSAQSGGSGGQGDPEPGSDTDLEQFLAREPAPLPASLEGTKVDGGVRADDQGRLIIEPRIRRMFEYFLSTVGEADLDTIKTWVAHYLDDQLPASAVAEGWALFEDYLDYRGSLDGMDEPGPDASVDKVASVMERRNALRREKLGAEAADAFFAAEEAYDRYMLRRRGIVGNDELTRAQKEQRLEQARAELPEPMQQVREETTRPVRAREKVEQMRAEGASEAEVRAWREANLGPEAADRLEKLEAERERWDHRYQTYRRELRRLDTSGLAEQEKQAAVERLREEHFDDKEQRRVQALDRIREEQGGERPDE